MEALRALESADAELFARVRRGDGDALAELVDRHKDGLVSYLTRMAGCRDRAEDFAQDAFVRLVERSDGYREQGHLKAYLYRIATNLLRSSERRERRWRLLAPVLAYAAQSRESPRQDLRLLRDELAGQILDSLTEVPLPFRVPLVLRDVEEWPYQEIASLLGCAEGTVKSRIHRGRELLRRLLQDRWKGDRP
jgi:RNA polymerase sigma-70 factor (ECF subfamily)